MRGRSPATLLLHSDTTCGHSFTFRLLFKNYPYQLLGLRGCHFVKFSNIHPETGFQLKQHNFTQGDLNIFAGGVGIFINKPINYEVTTTTIYNYLECCEELCIELKNKQHYEIFW